MDSAHLQSCPTTFSCFWDTSRTFSLFPHPHPLSLKPRGLEQFCENSIVTYFASPVSISNAMGKPNKGKKPSKEPTKNSTKDKVQSPKARTPRGPATSLMLPRVTTRTIRSARTGLKWPGSGSPR
jgi:hypothetical protein